MAVAAHEVRLETIGLLWLEAVNARDAEALVAIADPAIVLRPTPIARTHRTYIGHRDLREWASEMEASAIAPEGRLREVRALDEHRVLVRCEVLVDGQPAGPVSLIARIGETGMVVEANAYLVDEDALMDLGLIAR